jgi:hypothetical protein
MHAGRTQTRKTNGGPPWTKALHPRCPMRTTPPSWRQQSQRPSRAVEHTKPRLSELFLSPPMQTLIPYRSEYTSMRLGCGGGPNDPSAPVRGCFIRRAPTEISACWLKRSPSKGRSLGGGEWGEGVISPSSSSSFSSSSSSPEDSGSEGGSCPRAPVAVQAAPLSRLLCFCACHLSLSARLAS